MPFRKLRVGDRSDGCEGRPGSHASKPRHVHVHTSFALPVVTPLLVVAAQGNNIVQDSDCQCNYNLKGNGWGDWVDQWMNHATPKPGEGACHRGSVERCGEGVHACVLPAPLRARIATVDRAASSVPHQSSSVLISPHQSPCPAAQVWNGKGGSAAARRLPSLSTLPPAGSTTLASEYSECGYTSPHEA